MKSKYSQHIVRALAAAILFTPAFAHAHPGHSHGGGLIEGVAHPLLGLDHILAMLAVGFWAAQMGGRARWFLPAAFVSAMAAGAMLGMGGVSFPGVEQGIIASVLILGVLVAGAVRLPLAAGVGIVSVFAVFHGFAHAAEMPANASGVAYGIGFALSTILMHCAGLVLGLSVPKFSKFPAIRFASLAAVAGVFFL